MIDIFFSIAPFVDKAIMTVLVLFSVLVLSISLERYFVIKPVYRKSAEVRRKLKVLFKSGTLHELESFSKDISHPSGRLVSYALVHIKKHGSLGLAELLKSIYLQEKPGLEGSISILATVGANAPFLGLLGTVFGIMRSFHDLGAVQSAGQQTVMTGISIALLATAMGLAVAIPSVMLYNYFRRRVSGVLDTMENVGAVCLSYSQSHSAIVQQGSKKESGRK